MKGLFIPEITAEMFRNGCLESIEALMAEGKIYDIDYQQPCEDAISREKVFEQISCWVNSEEYRYTNATYYLTRRIQGISPVTPLPKIGHWIGEENLDGSIWYMCDNCKEFEYVNYYDYCPNCGAKMEG